jgi:hypothetical protein
MAMCNGVSGASTVAAHYTVILKGHRASFTKEFLDQIVKRTDVETWRQKSA